MVGHESFLQPAQSSVRQQFILIGGNVQRGKEDVRVLPAVEGFRNDSGYCSAIYFYKPQNVAAQMNLVTLRYAN